MWRAGAIVLLCGGVAQAAPAAALAAAQAAAGPGLRKGPYLQQPGPTSVHVLFELEAPAPASLTVERTGAAPLVFESPAALRHDVVASGLEPSRRYHYRVSVGGRSEEGELATTPAPGVDEPFSFVVYGDPRDDSAIHRGIVDRVAAEAPDFLVCTGDMVSHQGGWQPFFEVERPLLRDVPVYPTIGNHDDEGRSARAAYEQAFSLPDGGPQGESYYSFDYGASRFVVLDSNGSDKHGEEQTEWLDRTLRAARADARVKHLFAVMHHPPYSVATHGGDLEEQRKWVPLFERYRVNVVLSGHDHVYERMSSGGVLYIVSGGAGSSLYPRSMMPKAADKTAARFFERVHHYVRVQVDGPRVEIAGIRDDGSLIETLHLGGLARAPAALPAAPELPLAAVEATRSAAPVAVRAGADKGGFGCAVGGAAGGAAGGAVALALAVVLLRRRRRR